MNCATAIWNAPGMNAGLPSIGERERLLVARELKRSLAGSYCT